MVIFGAWGGERFCDNPKYLMHYLSSQGYKCIWVGNAYLKREVEQYCLCKFVEYGSWKSKWYALRSVAWFFCLTHLDVSNFALSSGAIMVNLWHGIPYKYMGIMTNPNQNKHKTSRDQSEFVKKLRINQHVWTTASSERMAEILVESYPENYSYNRIVMHGTPRNDFFVQQGTNDKLKNLIKQKYATILGLDPSKKWIVYMPTFRFINNKIFTLYGLSEYEALKLKQILDDNDAIIIEKHHHMTLRKQPPISEISTCSKVVMPDSHNKIDPQELMFVTDILITDYSSAAIDFALLKRPCIHFIYDYEDYCTKDSGLAYNLKDVAAGKCVYTFEELKLELEHQLQSPHFNPSAGFADLVKYENGNCCESVMNQILN